MINKSEDKTLFVWDLHGTLEKGNVNAVKELINLVLKESGIEKEITVQDALNWYGLSWFDYFKLTVPEGNQKIWKSMVDKVLSLQQRGWEIIKKHIKLRDFAEDVLMTIKKKGHQNILLSNTGPEHIRMFTDLLNITQYFDDIIGVDTNHNSRLGREVDDNKSRALAKFLRNKKYEKIVLIGDKESDIKTGKSCGAITYLFLDQKLFKEYPSTEADYTISNLKEALREI